MKPFCWYCGVRLKKRKKCSVVYDRRTPENKVKKILKMAFIIKSKNFDPKKHKLLFDCFFCSKQCAETHLFNARLEN